MTPSTMKLIARILLGLVALFLFASGLRFMLDPSGAVEGALIQANGAEGLSNVRALWGGAITAIAICVAIAAYTAKIENARPAVLFTFMLVLARIIGVAMDGAFDRIGLFIAIPVVVFLILLAAHKLLDKAHGAKNATV